ncbi:hypothetical protein QQF64_028004 [Cirrhinus molitorella]|uniref:Uncharacterized protein n=1 Tax=Cirrhinus molitorella TaxID=172907 RepID=A0ABR3NE06_9TELE
MAGEREKEKEREREREAGPRRHRQHTPDLYPEGYKMRDQHRGWGRSSTRRHRLSPCVTCATAAYSIPRRKKNRSEMNRCETADPRPVHLPVSLGCVQRHTNLMKSQAQSERERLG